MYIEFRNRVKMTQIPLYMCIDFINAIKSIYDQSSHLCMSRLFKSKNKYLIILFKKLPLTIAARYMYRTTPFWFLIHWAEKVSI